MGFHFPEVSSQVLLRREKTERRCTGDFQDSEFQVNSTKGPSSGGPTLENAKYLMASGMAGSPQMPCNRRPRKSLAGWNATTSSRRTNRPLSWALSIRDKMAEVVDPQTHIVAT